MEATLGYARTAEEQGRTIPPGHLAQAHIKQMLMLRVKEKRPDRPDEEGHGEAVLGLQVILSPQSTAEDRMAASYLRWYQAIVLADRGEGQHSFDLALSNARDDAHIMNFPDCYQIARRQYTHLRRFISNTPTSSATSSSSPGSPRFSSNSSIRRTDQDRDRSGATTGTGSWTDRTVRRLNLGRTLRPEGRPPMKH